MLVVAELAPTLCLVRQGIGSDGSGYTTPSGSVAGPLSLSEALPHTQRRAPGGRRSDWPACARPGACSIILSTRAPRGRRAVKRSDDRILTTHAGSLPR